MSAPHDPARDLQAAARVAAEHLAHQHGFWVLVLDALEVPLVRLPVPPGVAGKGAREAPPAPAAQGWVVTERGAAFDGAPVAVASSRLRLLKALVEAEGPLTAKDLVRAAFDGHTEDTNVRYHVRELRRELKAAFTFDEDIVSGDGEGYRLVLR